MKLALRILIPFALGCLVLAPQQAIAARAYLVELVVFSNVDGHSEESGPNTYPPLDAAKINRALLPSAITEADPATSKVKEIEESTFHTYVERIRRDTRKKILVEERWVQDVKDPDSTTIARITDVHNNETGASSIPEQESGGRFRKSLAMIMPVEKPADDLHPVLDGYVNFFLDGYYALETDLRYTPPYRPSILDDRPDRGQATYRIHEQRKMKSGELNYFDHPMFGMVLLVTPVKNLEEQPASEEKIPQAR
jgi:hypothetical protein